MPVNASATFRSEPVTGVGAVTVPPAPPAFTVPVEAEPVPPAPPCDIVAAVPAWPALLLTALPPLLPLPIVPAAGAVPPVPAAPDAALVPFGPSALIAPFTVAVPLTKTRKLPVLSVTPLLTVRLL